MPTDIVFDPAAADAARRVNQPKPKELTHQYQQSTPGQSPLDPLYDLHRSENLPTPEAARKAGERMRAAREFAVASPTQNAAMLAHQWGTPVDLVQKLLAAETEIFLLQADIRTLTARLDLLQAK